MIKMVEADKDKILELQQKPTILITNLSLTYSDLPLFEKILTSHIGKLKQDNCIIYSVPGKVLKRVPKELCSVAIPLDIFISNKISLLDIGFLNSHWLNDFL